MDVQLPVEYDFSQVSSIIDESTEQLEYVEFREPNAESALPSVNLYKLECLTRDSWVLPSAAYIELRCRVVGAGVDNGVNVTTSGGKPVPSGDIMMAFNTMKFFIENQEIANVNRVGQCRNIRNYVYLSKEKSDSVALSSGFYRRSVNSAVSSGSTMVVYGNPLAKDDDETPEAQLYNQFWKGIGNTTATSHTVCFHIPLASFVPAISQYGKILRGSKLRLELQRNTQMQEVLVSAVSSATPSINNELASLSIDYLSLWVPHVRLSPAAELKVNEFLVANNPYKMKIVDYELFEETFTFAQATSTQTARLITNTSRPLTVLVAFQADKRTSTTSGADTHGVRWDSSLYDHINLDQIEVRINGVSYPREALQIAGATRYLRVLDEVHRVGGKLYGQDGGALIDHSNWFFKYPIVAFNLTNIDSSVFSSRNRADLEIRFKIGSSSYSSCTSFTMLAVVEKEKELSIDTANKTMLVSKE